MCVRSRYYRRFRFTYCDPKNIPIPNDVGFVNINNGFNLYEILFIIYCELKNNKNDFYCETVYSYVGIHIMK